MKKVLLFKVNKGDVEYQFYASEDNHVLASIERDGRKVCIDAKPEDLSGKKTHIPATVLIALHTDKPSEQQQNKIALFERICLTRLSWCTSCLHAV